MLKSNRCNVAVLLQLALRPPAAAIIGRRKKQVTARFVLLFGMFCSASSAQSFTISGISGSGTFADQDYITPIKGTGTATVSPGGNVTLTIAGNNTRDRGFGCTAADVLQLSITLQFNSTDSLTILYTSASGGGGSASGSFFVTGGTGAYAGKGGSGTLTISAATMGMPEPGNTNGGNEGTFTITGSGSGTLTSQLTPEPTINPSGVVPVYSEVPIIQPGSWISIYGSNFASGTTVWNGNFPNSLGGVSVSIDGKLGYLWFVGPGQINLQAPDDTFAGCANVVVNTLNGQASYSVELQPQGPSLSLWPDGMHAVGLIYTSSGFDYLAPAGSVAGVTTRAANVGETISLYGVGFGPTKTPAPAGEVYSGPAVNNVLDGVAVTIGGKSAKVAFAGLVAEGLYQFNVVVPQVPAGDQLVQVTIAFPNPILGDNTQSQNNIYIPVQ
jgi:uncharacterized protein (TIGR03437 family)